MSNQTRMHAARRQKPNTDRTLHTVVVMMYATATVWLIAAIRTATTLTPWPAVFCLIVAGLFAYSAWRLPAWTKKSNHDEQ